MFDVLLLCGILLQDPPVPASSDPPTHEEPAQGSGPTADPTSTPQDPAPVTPVQDPPAQPSATPATTPAQDPVATSGAVPASEAGKDQPTPPASPPTTVDPAPNPNPAVETLDAGAASIPPITEQDLADVLELAGMNAVSSLEREVKSLQQTLDGLVLADDESVVKIHGAKGSEDDLESFGVDDAVARQVRRLLDEVKSKRAKLALLDLRGASSNNPNDGLRSVAEVAATAAANTTTAGTEHGAPASVPTVAAPIADPSSAPEDVLSAPSPDAQREALIAFRDRDVRTVLELLADTPMLRMKPLTLWAYGSCLMSERRYADAKAVFARLADERDHPQLAHGAKQQLARITFMENALVGEGPSTETTK
ncbi:MAG: hypothetical protein IPH13_07290 [Planctomycetes bacterium]|nr:hypothetical protein [Planctomycetota bacterium]